MKRIGVFICHCGINIAGTVDVKRVAEALKDYPGVVLATDYMYMCSDPGQSLIRQSIKEQNLEGVVVAACSPAMHEVTFRKASAQAGLNPYQTEIANIREQVSWVHQDDKEAATRKAIEHIKTIVEKVKYNESLIPLSLSLVKKALVIGGGIAGLQAAIDIATAGYPVVLVERSDRLGGHVGQLSGVYVNFNAARDLLQSKLQAVQANPRIQVFLETEVEELGGYVGNFTAKLKHRGGDGSEPTFSEHTFGAVIVATGHSLRPLSKFGEYGGGRYPDIIDALTFERMLAPDGPTGGEIRRPSDGQVPRQVVFVQCAGSRDPEHHMPYCSKICCMYTAKQAALYRQRVPDGQAYVFYIDIRSQGRDYEEFVQSAMTQHDVLYVRGKVARLYEEDGKVIAWGADTLTGKPVEVQADLAVLATAVMPAEGAVELAQKLRIATDEHGFFSEAHPKLRPVESLTAGIFLAGTAQAPKDIPETVAQASAAAAKVLSLFSQRELVAEPTIAYVDEELCSGCGLCIPACPYQARTMHPWKHKAIVNEALCQGCGACVVACPNKACKLRNLTPSHVLAMMDAYLAEV
ncbi:MAG: hypothetical protein Kow00123_06720 [Anaerolineales bacterium]